MNYGELKTMVQGRLQDSSASTLSQIANFVNVTYREMLTLYTQFHELETNGTITTVAGTQNYDLASDFERLYDVYQKGTPAKLTQLSADQFDNLKPNPTTTGKPLYYYLWGAITSLKQIYLYPLPDAVYTIYYRYIKKATTMVSDSDIPAIPDRWHWLIAQGAYAKASEYNEESTTNLANEVYYKWLEDYKKDIQRDNLDENSVIRVAVYDSWGNAGSTENPLNQ